MEEDDLLCQEIECLYRPGDVDEDFVKMLADEEINFGFSRDKSSLQSQEIKRARFDSITWMIKTSQGFRFQEITTYLSVTYFDQYLAKKPIQIENLWAVNLLSIACLSLAAKMNEVKATPLSHFEMDDYHFGSPAIKRMEFLVLDTLNWRMKSITPFTFIAYFISKFYSDDSTPTDAYTKAVILVMGAMREINFMDYRPSTIAACATLVVLDRGFTRNDLEAKINTISSTGILQIDDVCTCYTIMRKWEVQNLNTPSSPNLSPNRLRRTASPISPSASSAQSKRRRLTFDGNDQNIDRSDDQSPPC